MREFHFLETPSVYSIMFLVNGSANGCKNKVVYLEGSLGNAGMQVHNFEIDAIEFCFFFFKFAHIFYWALHFLILFQGTLYSNK